MCPVPERNCRGRPERGVLAGAGMLVPTAASSRLPDRMHETSLQPVVERPFDRRPNYQGTQLAAPSGLQATQDVSRLGFDHEDLRIVAKRRVGAEHDEVVGKPRHGCSQVRRGSLMPTIGQPLSVVSHNLDVRKCALGVEPARVNDDVGGMRLPVRGDHLVRSSWRSAK